MKFEYKTISTINRFHLFMKFMPLNVVFPDRPPPHVMNQPRDHLAVDFPPKRDHPV